MDEHAAGEKKDMKCNTCASSDIEFLFKNKEVADVRMKDVPCKVCICRECGQVFLDITDLTEQKLGEYYSIYNTFEKPGVLVEEHRELRSEQAGWVLDRLMCNPLGKRAIDVGCGTGYFLQQLQERGFSVEGVEFSSAMAEYIQNNYDIYCYDEGFHVEKVGREYSLVTCVTVLEHVLDPRKMVCEFNEILEDRGCLFIEVPDAANPRWDMIPDHLVFSHLHHWTERTLSNLLSSSGFEVVACDHIVNGPDSGNPEAVLRMLAVRKGDPDNSYEFQNDYEDEKNALAEYRQKHEGYVHRIGEKIRDIRGRIGQQPFAIYCGGIHTSSLLDSIEFDRTGLRYIFDGDKSIAGTTLHGIPVRRSSEIPAAGIRHFLLSTTNHERSIYRSLKEMDKEYKVYGIYTDLD